MKIKIDKEVEVCDLCRREGFLQTCLVCGASFCLTCDGVVPGCWVSPQICKRCDDNENVKEICQRFAKKITPIVRARDAALAKLIASSPHPSKGTDDG